MMKDIKKLKILIPIHLLPNDTSFHTLYFETVFSALREKISLEVIWLVYMHKKLKTMKVNNNKFSIINLFFFSI